MSGAWEGIIFDKDGTLFLFADAWDVWATRAVDTFAGEDTDLRAALAQSIRYDLEGQALLPDSPVIAGTSAEAAALFMAALPGRSAVEVEAVLDALAREAPLVPACPLAPLLDTLKGAGLKLGIMTNDAEQTARVHAGAMGVTDRFDVILGADSGFGGKPDPAPLLAAAEAMGSDAGHILMVGDSTHDLIAGRRAGMGTVGVLTGPAAAEDLARFADAVLPDIGHLPGWLGIDR